MTERTCPDCGLVEDRRPDRKTGRMTTNLDPVSGRCVGCLGREAVKRHTFPSRPVIAKTVLDPKMRAAGERE